MDKKHYNNNNILFISDTHAPFQHPKVLSFLKAVKEKFNPERVFHLGDLADQYMFSSYSKIPEADSLSTELRKTRKFVEQLGELFPKMIIVSSNHDDRLYKRSRLAGVPKEMILPYSKLIGSDTLDWRWVNDYTIRLPNKSHLYMAHTKGQSTLRLAQTLGMNVIVGHHHNSFGSQYFTTPKGVMWATDCGCLISDDSYAFAYNKMSLIRPTLGCTMVVDSKPINIPMEL